ncbi:MAG: hypothetical protein WBO35_04125 [Candidatus Saccharimonadales bacterium]
MTDKKLPKPKKKDRDWQEKIAKNVQKENIKLDHPQGFERFQNVLKRSNKKKPE